MSESVSVLMKGFKFCLCTGEQKVARKHQVAAMGKKKNIKKTKKQGLKNPAVGRHGWRLKEGDAGLQKFSLYCKSIEKQ